MLAGAAVQVLTSLVLLATAPLPPEKVDRIMALDGVFYYQPAASVFGAEAAWVNPGALGRYRSSSLLLMADYHEGRYGRSWGTCLSRDGLAVAYRTVYNPSGSDVREWIFSGGVPIGQRVHLGVSYRYFTGGPDYYNNRHLWNVGVVGLARGPFAFGAVLSNLNRGRVAGSRTEIEQRYSVAYRPFGPKLTAAVDLTLSTGTRLGNADYVYHAEYTPIPGLYLNAAADSDRNFQFGFRANLLKYFVAQRSRFDNRGHGGRTTAILGLVQHRQPSLIPEPRRRLFLGVAGRPAENPPRPVFGRKEIAFAQLITTIYRAADDPSVGEFVIALRGLAVGFGQAQELRRALSFFRSRGKRVVCHVTSPNNIGYYVASAANQILIPPVSRLHLVGLRAELTFYAGTLDKLGVSVELLKVGEYKTAAERYAGSASSPENRQQVNRLLDDLYEQLVEAIALGRGLTPDSVRRIIDNGPFTSAEALQYGLVDGLSYREDLAANYLHPVPAVSFRGYVADTVMNDGWEPVPVLALVVAEGEISSDAGDTSPLGVPRDITPAKMKKAFTSARGNRDARAIVFRLNSPGGSALASDAILFEAGRAAEDKPLFVSMSNVGASGAYYASMSADRIFANPATITGSIGIYGGKADFSRLYEKIALGRELYTRGKFAGMLSTTRPFTEEERVRFRSHLSAFYDHFLELVAENRRLAIDSADVIARGLVWTGREALANGLVDELGGLHESLEYAAERLGLSDYRIAIYPRIRPLFTLPGGSLLRRLVEFFGLRSPAETLTRDLEMVSGGEYLLARMPFDIEIE